jgi:fibronectin type 3 domain-containing protein
MKRLSSGIARRVVAHLFLLGPVLLPVGWGEIAAAQSNGLVAAYSFNEGTGTTVADASGNGNNGTVSGATWTTAGKYGNALVFNGTSARVTINDSASLHVTTGMTLEAWVNPSTVSSAWRDVIYKGNDNYYLEGTSKTSGRPAAGGTFAGSPLYGTAALGTNAWSHLAATYDGATLRLYVNGVQVASRAQTGAIATSTNPLQIGGDSIYGQYFRGTIDEVRVYNVALTAAQIQSDMNTPITSGPPDTQPPSAPSGLTALAINSGQINLSWTASTDNVAVTSYLVERSQGSGSTNFSQVATPTGTTYSDTTLAGGTTYNYRVRATDAAGNLSGYSNVASATTPAAPSGLVAAYSFDEGAGTTVTDGSGNGNNGTVSGTTWTSTGKYGSALIFNGTGALVTINDSTSLHLTTAMTLEAWVNPSTVSSAWRDVIYKGSDNYYLEATSSQSAVPGGGGTFGVADVVAYGTGALTANTWTHLAVTYDGTTLRLYVNGTRVASGAQTGNILTSTDPLQIGGDSIYGQYFQGTIDEVRVYNVVLTAAQIQSDMNTPVGNIPTPPGNLTAMAVSTNQINLVWTASMDNLGITDYLVERQGPGSTNFVQIGTTTLTSYSDTGLTAHTNYSYRVRAMDAASNLGPYSSVAQAYTGLAISPRAAVLTVTQTQQFTINFTGVSVNWSVDGVVGGSTSSGTITSTGLYTPPNSSGTHTVTATTMDQTQTANATVYVSGYPGTFMFHNDNFRTGQNPGETVLNPVNVNSATFGKLFSYPLDGMTFASPLYVASVNIPGKSFHNVVFVETEHDSVYAFDADGLTNAPLWQASFINPAAGVTTVPAADTLETQDIPIEIGITSTPLINPTNGTLYTVAATKEVSGSTTNYVQRLHALDITTGAEKFGGPVVIQASVAGTGMGSQGGVLSFDPLRENQRTGLLLANGVLYFGFSSHGDHEPFHGWLMGYNATTLQQVLVYCATPNGDDGGIWMDGDGAALDASGNIYFITGDGLFDANTGGTDYGDSFEKISSAGAVLDYFSPSVQSSLDVSNLDLGAGGVLLLPDQTGAHTHEMVSAGKNGSIYLVDRDNMGHFHTNSDQIVQSMVNIFTNVTGQTGGNFSSPVYFNGSVYFSPVQDNIQAFQLSNGLLSTTPTSRSAATYGGRGGTMAVSANGSASGILWALQTTGSASPGVLHAYDAGNLGNELYNSSQAGPRDTLDIWSKFSLPLVANGKVFVNSVSQLTVYGLLP